MYRSSSNAIHLQLVDGIMPGFSNAEILLVEADGEICGEKRDVWF
ncbi:hypothetical protein N836_01670 [Leptolyngbya sp. Heron Island J]|nr:hypothetical protein N836_01670 [Leptolyngbya sp. Heron Island J]